MTWWPSEKGPGECYAVANAPALDTAVVFRGAAGFPPDRAQKFQRDGITRPGRARRAVYTVREYRLTASVRGNGD
jgi:hypothetical protein